ncbi:MAG TPA: hypothetical protein VN456_12210 [Desulfosporosinus sp.]|nr:hypothetical protein [Desulfosporosinus sp.]
MLTNEKVRPALQCQTDQRKIQSRIIIPREVDFRPVCLWGFMGSVKEFRQFIMFQRIYLSAGVIVP